MKELLILRHAKSSWDNDRLSDHDRPLNERGLRTAPRMGRLLRDEGILPERILSSTAVRAATTSEAVAEAAGLEIEPALFAELYLADPETYFDLLRQCGDGAERIMVVGHNPGLEAMTSAFARRHEFFPTAALARVRLSIERWEELRDPAQGELVALWRPKELPPEAP